jgi:hypothetical protein
MPEFDPKQEATKIERLSKDALHEQRGDGRAERAILEEVFQLERDPAHLAAVMRQIKQDNLSPNTLPIIEFSMDKGDDTIAALVLRRGWSDIGSGSVAEKIDLNARVAARISMGTAVLGGAGPAINAVQQAELLNLK